MAAGQISFMTTRDGEPEDAGTWGAHGSQDRDPEIVAVALVEGLNLDRLKRYLLKPIANDTNAVLLRRVRGQSSITTMRPRMTTRRNRYLAARI
jgi:hypothetical protein